MTTAPLIAIQQSRRAIAVAVFKSWTLYYTQIRHGIVNLRCEGQTCAESVQFDQAAVIASQVAKERDRSILW